MSARHPPRKTGPSSRPDDLVVMAVGIRPAAALGSKTAGLEIGRGIHVDAQMITSDPAIFALGECVEHVPGAPCSASLPRSIDQAKVAGQHAGVSESDCLPA